jgi:hypothetical protein
MLYYLEMSFAPPAASLYLLLLDNFLIASAENDLQGTHAIFLFLEG